MKITADRDDGEWLPTRHAPEKSDRFGRQAGYLVYPPDVQTKNKENGVFFDTDGDLPKLQCRRGERSKNAALKEILIHGVPR